MRFYNIQTKSFTDKHDDIIVDHKDFSIILTFPHSGHLIPEELLEYIDVDSFYYSLDHEWYLDQIYPCVGTRIIPSISRYAVNLNRSSGKPPQYVDMWKRNLLKKPIPQEVLIAISRQYYQAYYFAVEQAIERMKMLRGFALVLDCHSYNSVGLPLFPDPGKERPAFNVADGNGTSCGSQFTSTFVEALENNSHGWHVGVNAPYKGGYFSKKFGKPSEGVHVLQLEVQRKLFMVECLELNNVPATALQFLPTEAKNVQGVLSKAVTALKNT